MLNLNQKAKENSADYEAGTIGPQLSFAASEAYKRLRTALTFSSVKKEGQQSMVIGVTSSLAGEGKSTASINIAYAFASSGKQTLLMEADMRLPGISRRLGLKTVPGLSEYLVGEASGEVAFLRRVQKDSLYVIPCGSIPPNPSELLDSQRMADLLNLLSGKFDVIIVDLPPIGSVTDALIVAKQVDGMLMVVRKDYGNKRALDDAMRQLNLVNAKVLGFVFNDSTGSESSGGKYKYYHGYRRYGYGYGYSSSGSSQQKEG